MNPNTIHLHNLKKVVEINNMINKVSTQFRESKIYLKLAGAISYSVPCAALLDRSFENEIRRLEVEAYNSRILELYEKPLQVLSNFHIDDKGIMSLL